MYADLDKRTVKALNRLDRRRRMKYDGRRKGARHAEELGAARQEVAQATRRDARQFPWPANGYLASHR